MTREDIIAMAREAGSCDSICNGCLKVDVFCEKSLERFVELVEDAHSKRTFDEGMVTVGHMRQQIAAEREACASMVEDMDVQHPKYIAAAIRARGQA
jgi:transposase-like protein